MTTKKTDEIKLGGNATATATAKETAKATLAEVEATPTQAAEVENTPENTPTRKSGRKPRADKPADEAGLTVRISAAVLEDVSRIARFKNESLNAVVGRIMAEYAAANTDLLNWLKSGEKKFNVQ